MILVTCEAAPARNVLIRNGTIILIGAGIWYQTNLQVPYLHETRTGNRRQKNGVESIYSAGFRSVRYEY